VSQWQTIRLGSACEKIGSGATPRGGSEVYQTTGISLIRSQNIYNDGFKRDGLAFIGDKHARELENVNVMSGDVLLNITGDSVARVCQVPEKILPARVNQHVAIIRPKKNVLDARFLHYFLIHPQTQAHMLGLAGAGATRNALTKGMIESFEIKAPSFSEQRAIASVLGALDDKIELNRRLNETLEALAQSLFKSWFVDATQSALPKGWKLTRLKDLTTKIGSGATPRGGSAVYVKEGVALIRSQNIYDHEFHWDGLAHLTDEAAKDLQGVEVKPDDILLNITGDSILRTCVVEPEALPARVNQHVAIIRAKPGIPPRFLHLCLVQQQMKHFLAGLDAGATRQAITKGQLEAVEVLHPPGELLDKFAELTEPIFQRINSNRSESRTLVALRDALLPKLLSGELRVPAAVKIKEAMA
jgi:type I restriction enzyme S subunit